MRSDAHGARNAFNVVYQAVCFFFFFLISNDDMASADFLNGYNKHRHSHLSVQSKNGLNKPIDSVTSASAQNLVKKKTIINKWCIFEIPGVP